MSMKQFHTASCEDVQTVTGLQMPLLRLLHYCCVPLKRKLTPTSSRTICFTGDAALLQQIFSYSLFQLITRWSHTSHTNVPATHFASFSTQFCWMTEGFMMASIPTRRLEFGVCLHLLCSVAVLALSIIEHDDFSWLKFNTTYYNLADNSVGAETFVKICQSRSTSVVKKSWPIHYTAYSMCSGCHLCETDMKFTL